ncbi:MAG: hypothetical protein WDN44_05260 [Sphingomonas sp.]
MASPLKVAHTLLQPALVLSALFGSIIAFFVLQHHNIKAESPVFRSAAQATHWIAAEESGPGAPCLKWTVDEKVHEVADNSGSYATFRCNSPAVFYWLVGGFLAPGLVLILTVSLATASDWRPARRR